MTVAALVAIAGAMLLVRLGWAARRALALLGWGVAVAALAALGWRDGAWGLALGTVAGTGAIALILLHAGWASPTGHRHPAREAPPMALPWRWRDFGRRLAVFALVVPVGFAAAQWFAFGAQALARRAGDSDSNTTVLMLILQPLLWTAIMSVQMTRSGPARMVAAPAVVAGTGTLLWSLA